MSTNPARYADFSEDAATALAFGNSISIVNVRDLQFSKARQSCFEYPAKGGEWALPSRDSVNVSCLPRMSDRNVEPFARAFRSSDRCHARSWRRNSCRLDTAPDRQVP